MRKFAIHSVVIECGDVSDQYPGAYCRGTARAE
jgi:hypothetical protein